MRATTWDRPYSRCQRVSAAFHAGGQGRPPLRDLPSTFRYLCRAGPVCPAAGNHIGSPLQPLAKGICGLLCGWTEASAPTRFTENLPPFSQITGRCNIHPLPSWQGCRQYIAIHGGIPVRCGSHGRRKSVAKLHFFPIPNIAAL